MPRWGRRLLRVFGVAILIVVFAVLGLTVRNTFGWAGHVTWGELGSFNIEKFERQFREALPVGTPKSTVDAYLTREKIPFSYDRDRHYFRVYELGAVHALLYFPGDLSIHVELDHDLKVSEVRFSIMYK